MVDLNNCKVIYKLGLKIEEGTVISFDSKVIKVIFYNQDKTPVERQFEWRVFKTGKLTLVNENLQEQVLAELAEQEEKDRKEQEENEKRRLEEERKREEEQRNRARILLVFQGQRYGYEWKGGYISAPVKDKADRNHHFWSILEELKEGDVLFHASERKIKAVSVVTEKARGVMNNEGEITDYRVKCEYVPLESPMIIEEYKEQIIELCKDRSKTPFDKNGNGKQGYCYDIPGELAKLFKNEILKNNTGMDLGGYLF